MGGYAAGLPPGGGGGGGGGIDLTDSVLSVYGTVLSVPPATRTMVLSHTVGSVLTHLMNVEFGGLNIARYWLVRNGTDVAQSTTHYGKLTGTWDFRAIVGGMPLGTGDIIRIEVEHHRPWSVEFYGRLNMLLITDPQV